VRYFNSDLPFSALYGTRGLGWTSPIQDYYSRAQAGTLPPITFVDPPFRDGGGGNGVSADDHPHGDIRLGQAFLSDVVHAFLESPQWRRGALFVVYDEWGGFFDHVVPPHVPDERANHRNQAQDWGQMGFRIPALAISPYARRGAVSHSTLGFESILKLISHRYSLGTLNRRHRHAFNIGRTFDWESPNFEVPDLPDPAVVATAPCAAGGGGGFPDPTGGPRARAAKKKRPKPHDLTKLETSGYLERLGYDVPEATYERIYRNPDSFKKALASSEGA
jgi:phospholipase C